MQIIIEIPKDNIPTMQCYKDVLIKFVDKQVCEVTLIGQIPSEDDMGLWFDVLPEKHGDIIDRGFMVAKLLDEILFDRVKTPMDCIDFIKNYKITVPATEGFTPYFCQNRLPEKEETDEGCD